MPYHNQDRGSVKKAQAHDAFYDARRWRNLDIPLVYGTAVFEWNILDGTTWFSEGWRSIIQEEYDDSIPNDQAWWVARVHPEDLSLLYRSVLAIHAGFLDRYETVFRFKRADGVWLTLLHRCIVTQRTAEGAPHIACGVSIDITDTLSDSSIGLASLMRAPMDIQTMLENSPDLFIRFDREFAPVYVNPAINKYLGGMSRQIEGAGEEKARLTGHYKDVFRKNVQRVFTERKVTREELVLSLSNGREVIGDCVFWPEYNEAGELQFAMAQFRDITAQRAMEQRNMLNEQRLEALNRLTSMEKVSDKEMLRFVLESVLSITSSRSGFIFIYNQQEDEKGFLVWSQDHYDLVPQERYFPDEHLPEDILIQIRDKGIRSINNGDGKTPLYRVFDNKMQVMRGILAPVMEGERVVCVSGVCNKDSDYDEFDMLQFETFLNSAWLALRRRRFIEELQKAKEAAEAANKAKDAFLANVSHELRTPLNGVLSMLQLIDSFELDEQKREYLYVAAESGKALLRIISDLLDFSCMESGKMSLAEDIFNCRSVVQSACDMFIESASSLGLGFSSQIDPGLPELLVGDEGRLRQIIFNLVGNSLKFTPEGRIEVSCLPYEGPTPEGKSGIALKVSDTGIGIPADKLASIFDAFLQVESQQRGKYPGTGLGLSIVKHLVTLMGGDVSVESKEGVGTSIYCHLFFSLPSPNLLVIPYAKKAEENPAQGRSLDILAAEDDAVGSMAIRAFLKKRGHRVVCVADGVEALEAMQLRHFDCLFTDIAMPNLDGIELVRRLRAGDAGGVSPSREVLDKVREIFPDAGTECVPLNPQMLVTAVSAHAMIGDRERFLAQGMDLYISKPIISAELDEVLGEVKRRLEKRP